MAVGNVGTCKTLPTPGSRSRSRSLSHPASTPLTRPVPDAAINDWIAWGADLDIFTGDYNYAEPDLH